MKTQARGEIRRSQILAFVRERFEQASYAASIRDIAAEVGASPATVHRHIRVLAAQGLIAYRPGTSRTIRPVTPYPERSPE